MNELDRKIDIFLKSKTFEEVKKTELEYLKNKELECKIQKRKDVDNWIENNPITIKFLKAVKEKYFNTGSVTITYNGIISNFSFEYNPEKENIESLYDFIFCNYDFTINFLIYPNNHFYKINIMDFYDFNNKIYIKNKFFEIDNPLICKNNEETNVMFFIKRLGGE